MTVLKALQELVHKQSGQKLSASVEAAVSTGLQAGLISALQCLTPEVLETEKTKVGELITPALTALEWKPENVGLHHIDVPFQQQILEKVFRPLVGATST